MGKQQHLHFIVFVLMILSNLACKENGTQSFEPPAPEVTEKINGVELFLTTANKSSLLDLRPELINNYDTNLSEEITIDPLEQFQELDGFGFALTGGSVSHMLSMGSASRAELLEELFGNSEESIGLSYIRISIGASDLDGEVYSYNDLPQGEEDHHQENFSIDRDQQSLLPLLKEILTINPDINIMASPWSPPVWMKTNGNSVGGSLRVDCYEAYALYLTKYIQSMKQEGISIKSITIQNEPLHDGNNPSMHMTASEQAEFIKVLGPVFREYNIETEIIAYDHNADRPDYPIEVLNDDEANQYVSGSAFHLYGGSIEALSSVHTAHPDKAIHFTEQWYGAPGDFSGDLKWHIREVVIGSMRNWSKSVIEWNLSSNPTLTPHTPGGCTQCLGAITIDNDQVIRNSGYYTIGHVSKFVKPGSKRVTSNYLSGFPNVSFENTDGDLVLVILNENETRSALNISAPEKQFSISLDPGAVATILIEQ